MKQLTDFMESAPQRVSDSFEPIRFEAGAPILWEGEEDRWVYLLLEGSAEGYLQSAQGTVSSVFYYQPGSLFGEFEVFAPGATSSTSRPSAPAACCGCRATAFWNG
ncbi:cyclic nucleotide-binding domain-containing protein [Anaerofilum sp. BX8]|uniref:Cyclic nucleotide-binding domain-containing protein n=1 Tax=Anaerofilum hominis TaxID=2763016 RepID=A0A923IAC0_9FIRM|nr:cyclic nucleotide-binding domain-containing protein [Anaerofilum hominis]MBC5581756.1 cyclic nucleotide-binding domain-containing protein [Anaerofilum hominis]